MPGQSQSAEAAEFSQHKTGALNSQRPNADTHATKAPCNKW